MFNIMLFKSFVLKYSKGYYCGNKTSVIDYHSKQRVNIDKEDWKIYEDNENVPPIVSESLWNRAQNIINERSKKSSKDKTVYQNRYPFSGKIYCMKHNTTYRRKVNISSGIKKKRVVTWRCSEFLKYNSKGCDGPILYDNELKSIVGKTILSYISNINVVDDLIKEYKELKSNTNIKDEIVNKQKRIELLEKKKSKLLDLILKKIITEDDFKIQSDEIVNEIHKLKEEVLILERNNINLLEDEKYLNKIKKKALELLEYENADIDSLIYEFLDKIEINETNNNDFINLRIILNTGNDYSISFNNKKHPFCTDYTNNIPIAGNSSFNSGFNCIYIDTNELFEAGIPIPESKYFDSYSYSDAATKYYGRILGDATGEMGPFWDNTLYQEFARYSSSWYSDLSHFYNNDGSFMSRGGAYVDGNIAGVCAFYPWQGVNLYSVSFRIILTPT